jgi:hypothetical protein
MAPFPTVKGLQAVPKVAGAAGDIVTGAVGTGTNYIAKPGRTPRGYQVASQRNPIGAKFIEPEEYAKFTQGELPYGQMPEQLPIGDLPKNTLDRAAMMLSGGNIPNKGQGARAFGERLGETYRNPYTAAADIGSMFLTGGVPVLTTLRGGLGVAQALADMRLANKGFTPDLPKILNEYQTGARPMPGQPGPMPTGAVQPPPQTQAVPTPAAQAAAATTQAKVQQTTGAAVPQAEPITGLQNTIDQVKSVVGENPNTLRSATISTHAETIKKQSAEKGVVIDKNTAKKLATEQYDKHMENIKQQTANARKVEEQRIAAEKKAAFEATPEGQAQLGRTTQIEQAMAADAELAAKLEQGNLKYGTNKQRAIEEPGYFEQLVAKHQEEIAKRNAPKVDITEKIQQLKGTGIFTPEEKSARAQAIKTNEKDTKALATPKVADLPNVLDDVPTSTRSDFRNGLTKTISSNIRSKNKEISIDKKGIDDYLRINGFNPVEIKVSLKGKSKKEANDIIFDAIYEQVKQKFPTQERHSTISKRLEAEAKANPQPEPEITPEIQARMDKMQEKAKPKINSSLQAALDRLKSQGNYKPPTE